MLGRCQVPGYKSGVPAKPFTAIADEYDKLNDILSWGLHRLWKRRLVRLLWSRKPAAAAAVLDVATGTGDLARLFRGRTPGFCRIVGVDPCPEMLSLAKDRMPELDWILAGAESLPLPDNSVGILSCVFGVRNFDDRKKAFLEWKRVLIPGAVVGVIEIHPVGRGWASGLIRFYWKYLVPAWGQLLAKRTAYEYLRDSGATFLSPGAMRSEIADSGLQPIYFTSLFPCGMVSLSLFRNGKATGQENADRRGDLIR